VTRPPFPHVLDSSLMAAFKSCPQKANLEFFQHWKPGEQSIHLHAGKCYASGIEAARIAFYVDGKSPEESLALPSLPNAPQALLSTTSPVTASGKIRQSP